MKHIYITGGEPFYYSNPNNIAWKLKRTYPNIERVVVYSNAYELDAYIWHGGETDCIDGITISIKSEMDRRAFSRLLGWKAVTDLPYNRLYVFPGYEDVECPASIEKIQRVWQEEFVPAPNCIFRRL